MKKKNVILTLVLLALITFGIVSIAYSFLSTVDVKDTEIDFRVGSHMGINLDFDKIWLGTVLPGGSATRGITITNSRDYPVVVSMYVLGDISENTGLSESKFVLQKDESKEISIVVVAPSNMPYGNYTGTLRTVVKKQCVLFC